MPTARPPSATMLLAVASAPASSRSRTATAKPSAASRREMPAPMPRAPPVTIATRSWDSRTICYPALIRQHDKLLMFYNGNDMGVDGFGLAETSMHHLDGGADDRG